MCAVSIEFDQAVLDDPNAMKALNDYMAARHEELLMGARSVAHDLNISHQCALDVIYLRSRSRWTEELEAKLIQLHKDGIPPNVMEFG